MRIPHSSMMQRDFGVSMTPMIDVVFLLLIFFVCTASFQITESILPSPLQLEGTSAVEPSIDPTELDLERVLIGIAQQNGNLQLTVNSQPCPSLERLSKFLLAIANVDRTLPVILDISDETQLGLTIDVYDRCRIAGFRKIQFAAKARE